MKLFFGFCLVVIVFALIGAVGAMDQQDAIDYEARKCELINKGLWGADYETRQRCTLIKGE